MAVIIPESQIVKNQNALDFWSCIVAAVNNSF